MRIAICDDEAFYVEDIKANIRNYEQEVKETFTVFTFTNPSELLESCRSTSYNLVYLDIEMDDYNGIKIAEEIKKMLPSCLVIFVTAHIQYFNESFHVEAFQYLLKPIDPELFRKELIRALKKHKASNRSLIFPTTHGNHVLNFNEVLYIETSYREYKIHCQSRYHYGNIKSYQKIRDILTEHNFFKIQRSYLVNLEHVKELNGDEVVMSNGDNLVISRKNLKAFKMVFFRFLEK